MLTSIIESKNYVPEVLRKSRDFQSFCKLFDLIINSIKNNIDYYVNLIDMDSCPDSLLPLLASYVGYKYDYTESYDANRIIIKNYPSLIRNRGSEVGISLAAALSLNTLSEKDIVEALNMFSINYKKDDTKIEVYIFFPAELSKVRDLIEVARPAGCGLELIPSQVISSVDEIQIYTYGYGTRYAYDLTRYTVSNETKVGFSEVTNKEEVNTSRQKTNSKEKVDNTGYSDLPNK